MKCLFDSEAPDLDYEVSDRNLAQQVLRLILTDVNTEWTACNLVIRDQSSNIPALEVRELCSYRAE